MSEEYSPGKSLIESNPGGFERFRAEVSGAEKEDIENVSSDTSLEDAEVAALPTETKEQIIARLTSQIDTVIQDIVKLFPGDQRLAHESIHEFLYHGFTGVIKGLNQFESNYVQKLSMSIVNTAYQNSNPEEYLNSLLAKLKSYLETLQLMKRDGN